MIKQRFAGALRDDDRGAVAVMVALLAIVIFGIGAFAVDMGIAYASKREQSVTSDAAALAGAQAAGSQFQTLYPTGTACTSAVESALTDAATKAATDVYVAQRPQSSANPTVTVKCSGVDAIDVTVQSKATFDTVLGGLLGVAKLNPGAAATARVSGSAAYSGLRPYAVCGDSIVRGNETLTQQSLYLNTVDTSVSGMWTYVADTTMDVPADGSVRFSADLTQMAISEMQSDGKKFTGLNKLATGYTVQMQAKTDPAKFGKWSVVSSTSKSGWYLVDLKLLSDPATLPSTGSSVTLTFTEAKKPGVTCGPLGSGNWGIVDFDGGANTNGDIARWTQFGYNQPVKIPDPAMPGDPGIDTSSPVKSALDSIVGTTVLLPVAQSWNEGSGNNGSFYMSSVIAVKICGYQDGKQAPVKGDCWSDALADPALNKDPAVAEADFKLQWQWRPGSASYLPGGTSPVECSLSGPNCLPAVRLYR